jgi:cytoplasmic iron level regulating protein YaaA (DUF328/UPF0246 family)
MITLLSPAKKQDLTPDATLPKATDLHFKAETAELVEIMRTYEPHDLCKLMSISERLGQLNFMRYVDFDTKHYTDQNSRPAIFAFKGDVYQTLDAPTLTPEAIAFSQTHLRLLSGLYGVLKPLDAIQAHRLEMGTKLPTPKGKKLYDFWGDSLTEYLNQALKSHANKTVINLSSIEYFGAINTSALNATVIKVDFKENKNGQYKTIGLFAKRARGMMARFIMQHHIDEISGLEDFDSAGYAFNAALSNEHTMTFTR